MKAVTRDKQVSWMECNPADTLTVNFLPTELQKNKFLLF